MSLFWFCRFCFYHVLLRQCHQCVFVKITNLGPKNATFSEKSTTTFKKAPWKPLLWRYLTYKWSGFSENRRVHATWPGLCDWLICLAGDLKNNNFFSFSHQQGSLISFPSALVSTNSSLHASWQFVFFLQAQINEVLIRLSFKSALGWYVMISYWLLL